MDYSFAKSNIASAENYHDLSGLNSIKTEQDDSVALKKVAQQFESLFVNELLKNMRNANKIFEQDSLFNSGESDTFRDMYDQQLSVHLSNGRGLGLADVLFQQLSRQYLADDAEPSSLKDLPVPARSTDRHTEAVIKQSESPAPSAVESKSPTQHQESKFASAREFVEQLLPLAEKVAAKLALNPAVMIAQAALETGWGKHIIVDKDGESSFNLFNIKASDDWTGESVAKVSSEFLAGQWVKQESNFRKYSSFEESFNDFYRFISENPRYQQAVEKAHSSAQFIEQLQRAGYATDPEYANKILSIYDSIVSPSSNDAARGE